MEAFIQQTMQSGNLWFMVAVFLSAMMFTLAITNLTTSWFGTRKRAVSEISELVKPTSRGSSGHILIGDPTNSSFGFLLPKDESQKSELRKFLNLAGYYGATAPITYQIIRIACALALGFATPFVYRNAAPNHPFAFVVLASVFMALLGYMLPRSLVSLRRDKLLDEHRRGFPDFLDLLVICVEAGIGIESAIERVSKDMARSFPSLAKNLEFMNLEMRAGRALRDALGNLAQRLGIDEVKSFATLIQQSEELGSSLVQSLRVYSDEMRAKRLARAEEKAYALPVKMVIPLGFFCFPVVLGVTLFPVALKVLKAFGN
jgi:tight adherence protein C